MDLSRPWYNQRTPKPNVTMFADASVRYSHKTAGWGYWIKGDSRHAHMKGGPILPYTNDVGLAELIAIKRGLETARDINYFMPDDRVIMIQSDSMNALTCMRIVRKSIKVSKHPDSKVGMFQRLNVDIPAAKWEAVKEILIITDKLGLEIVVRHVKGHSEGNGRSWVNRMCDRLAKKGAGVI